MGRVYLSWIAIVIALSMMAGATYAWFADQEDFGTYTFETAEVFEEVVVEDLEVNPDPIKVEPEVESQEKDIEVEYTLQNQGAAEAEREITLELEAGEEVSQSHQERVTLEGNSGSQEYKQVEELTFTEVPEELQVTLCSEDDKQSISVPIEEPEEPEEES